MAPAVRSLLETRDLDEAQVIMRTQLGAEITRVDGPLGRLRLDMSDVGSAQFARGTFGMDFKVAADPFPDTYLNRVRDGWVAYQVADRVNCLVAGDLGVAARPGIVVDAVAHHLDTDYVVISAAAFAEVAHTRTDHPPSLTDDTPISAAAARTWRRAHDFVLETLAEPETSELALGAARRLLVAATLATFPNDAQLDPTIEDRHDAHTHTLRRAVAFIDANPGEDITLADIARAAYVTPRAIQLAFRRHLNTTPMAYLRRVRLEQAHGELTRSTRDQVTITQVASRWGWSPNRFSAAYLAAYGQHPSTTLHQ